MFSYFEPNFIEKFLWKSGFANFGKNRNDAKIKIGYLAAILKRYNIFIFFSELWFFYSPYIYGANFIAKFPWQKWFSTVGSLGPPPPWAPTGIKVPWSLKCYSRCLIHVYCYSTRVIWWYSREISNISSGDMLISVCNRNTYCSQSCIILMIVQWDIQKMVQNNAL